MFCRARTCSGSIKHSKWSKERLIPQRNRPHFTKDNFVELRVVCVTTGRVGEAEADLSTTWLHHDSSEPDTKRRNKGNQTDHDTSKSEHRLHQHRSRTPQTSDVARSFVQAYRTPYCSQPTVLLPNPTGWPDDIRTRNHSFGEKRNGVTYLSWVGQNKKKGLTRNCCPGGLF